MAFSATYAITLLCMFLAATRAASAPAGQAAYTNAPLLSVQAAAERDDPDAQRELARRYFFGMGVTSNLQESLRWEKRAAERGNTASMMSLGSLYETGWKEVGIASNRTEAGKWWGMLIDTYRKAAEKGDSEAQYKLAMAYKYGWHGVQKNGAETIRLLSASAALGNTRAMREIGDQYHRGNKELGIPKDRDNYLKWYRKAAEAGDARAQCNLGSAYSRGDYYWQDGRMYWKTKPDEYQAARWYEMAAEQGDSEGQFELGMIYREDTDAVPRPYDLALRWLSAAAQQGHQGAQYALAGMYHDGLGTPQNYAAALKWYRAAADDGNSPFYMAAAQKALGLMCCEGEGIPKDLVEAYRWLSLAASSKYPPDDAAQLRDSVLQKMTPLQVAEGQRRAAGDTSKSLSPGTLVVPDDEPVKGTGTGFFITPDGYLLTASHVVAESAAVKVRTSARDLPAVVVRVDSANDVALLKVRGAFTALPLAPSRKVRLGESVFTIGFPNTQIQGVSPKLTKGEISSLAGIQDDPRHFQVSVPVQPGNSGGPLVDMSGNVVGVIVLRLGDAATVRLTGSLPQNVNYAVKSAYVQALLESRPEVAAQLPNARTGNSRPFEGMVKEVEAATVIVLVY